MQNTHETLPVMHICSKQSITYMRNQLYTRS